MSSTTQPSTPADGFRSSTGKLKDWLLTNALPCWQELGLDKSHGGFHEALELGTGHPADMPKRARVQPRQIYSFIEAGRLGWQGPWQTIARQGLDWFRVSYRLEGGTVAASVSADGSHQDPAFDLYNQAFALFGLGQAASVFEDQKEALLQEARDLLAYLRAHYAHPERGFREANPDKLPLCSNPHMHMFEAALALSEVDPSGPWAALADEIATLAMTRFIDKENGGLREFFALDWSPMPGDLGRVMEPGHQFEWAWLLAKWGDLRNNSEAIAKARRLYEIGMTYGICPQRQVAIMALNDDFSVRDPLARLWGQTEWIKAAAQLAVQSEGEERDAYLKDAVQAIDALFVYFDVSPRGLWRDKLLADGSFKEEPAPASSFYHIICAIAEADRVSSLIK
ncbi:AGE family epimerase/isomerase [Roseibium litorale]|uniref:AGE family epimerase/isomerase n=1 Tax=Roseibium litorale TaxID=2803841 RepID=A0ABR9CPQ0_9HYPH|nr:AGE family epimerase/isomerase [Roseibium litorale]MBD8892838.1 AGE family epimerase/isomerase [Roseibium litorale]